MYVGEDFIDTTPSETRRYAFDFSDALADDETIASSVWGVAVAANSNVADANVGVGYLVGAPANATPESSQQINFPVSGCRYLITCVITTNLANVIEYSSHVLAASPI